MGGCVSSRSATALIALDAERSDANPMAMQQSARTWVKLESAESKDHEDAEERASSGPTVWSAIQRRFPWLLVLMLVQSISGVVVEHFSSLVERHVVLASFLTMLVGGGGNSSGQTVVETVRLLSSRKLAGRDMLRVLLRELAIGAVLAGLLGVCAYPRVRLLSSSASHVDALTIAISYALIVVVANAIGVIVAISLHTCDMAAVGAPPVVQVTVDVLGVTLTMLIAQAVMGAS